MKSLLAVALQLFGSAVNYAVFIIVARHADAAAFIAFSTAVGLNMFAFALAEGGISYIAPREIETGDGAARARLSLVFLTVTIALYAITMALGYIIWNSLGDAPLHAGWVLAYALNFSPMLLLPAWLTQLSVTWLVVAVYALARVALLAWLAVAPGIDTLTQTGAVNLLLAIAILAWLDRGGRLLRPFRSADLQRARTAALGVIGMKSLSYAVYGALPMAIGILIGNAAAAVFVAGERLKALYATAFRPLVQTLYLRACRTGAPAGSLWRRAGPGLLALNIAAGVVAWVTFDPLVGWMYGGNVVPGAALRLFLVAAVLSVGGSILLFFLVLPLGRYRSFTRALAWQTFVLVVATVIFAAGQAGATGAILVSGEAALLIALVVGWLRER